MHHYDVVMQLMVFFEQLRILELQLGNLLLNRLFFIFELFIDRFEHLHLLLVLLDGVLHYLHFLFVHVTCFGLILNSFL